MSEKSKKNPPLLPSSPTWFKPIYSTAQGEMYCGLSEDVLKSKRVEKKYKGNAQLIFTSPPFPLNKKKKYGNLRGEKYIKWFADFAPILKKYLKRNGSIVIEIGNAWEPGKPVMSTVVLKALLAFLERGGLHLCQEFIWYNPARLPSPAQWVTIERIRVKDAFTRIWWMSPSERPKADNRNVLREYSKSMQKLLDTGSYNAGLRPSQHVIGTKSFNRNNGGAIPPNVIDGEGAASLNNLLKASNTHSTDQYQAFCKENNIPSHPARMPADLVEFFIKLLTDKGDTVLDPFAGSNTTGATAQKLERKWISIEVNENYAASSISRFNTEASKKPSSKESASRQKRPKK